MIVQVIPVPDGYTVEDAVMEIEVLGHISDEAVDRYVRWAVVEVDA